MTITKQFNLALIAFLSLGISGICFGQSSSSSPKANASAAKPAKSSTSTTKSSAATTTSESPAASASTSASTTTSTTDASTAPAARPEVYHVHFVKAATGKSAQLADQLKKPDPKSPMPGHNIILRHQDGDAWDYVVIEHLGTKATVEATGNPPPPEARSLRDWHNDTFVNGPSWADFSRQMGIGDDSTKSSGSVYVVSVYRPVAGHDDQLEKMLSEPPNRAIDTSSGNVLMQHLEGAPWRYLTIARYNSWNDFATNESNSVAQSSKGEGGWFQLREHASFHNDTLANRISP